MSKMEVFDRKQTSWIGLWYHPEVHGYTSSVISLAKLRKFKGAVRLYIRKNKYFQKGGNRPNYNFCIKSCDSGTFTEVDVIEDSWEWERPYKRDGEYFTEDNERLFTYDEVLRAVRCAADDGARGYTEVLVEDYL